ncbi:hypothetical protein Caci_3036 [Catenulispora acidiphila DSM 44928]|uniref:Uncharacterized protein n=1 Tax=Catenulispora acidiphila (strain DSM 44928 / JCM 14897 / NBRC 102108 / NRRL B-24433 / ID139908) TaxID=479433 RepID=C7Q4H6_CATAD|nr:hypothetical protein [Catenulispora acidiphila]ACU71945.1 hypothetical protein Caci_3036 [Catenulispora acidiphila DSM 44928]
MTAIATERPHGYTRYKADGCRCYTRCWAVAEYNDRRERAIAYGTWRPFVDAQPVRDHVNNLRRCGIGQRRIAQLSGVSGNTLTRILYGAPAKGLAPTTRMRPEIAVKLMAVRPGPFALADGIDIDCTGSARRVQALVAIGWPQEHLGARIGMSGSNLIASVKQRQITAGKARAIAALYLLLENADPLVYGVSGTSRLRAVLLAERNRWAKPATWDGRDIDDAAAFPDWTGACGTVEGFTRHQQQNVPACWPCETAETAARAKAIGRAA